jgi:hypothetical protein
MVRPKKRRDVTTKVKESPTRSTRWRLILGVGLIIVVAIVAVAAYEEWLQILFGKATQAEPTGTSLQATPEKFKPLLGRWQRTGEVYVLDVGRVAADGTVEAQYFNPMPIRVGKAQARDDDGTLKLVVELRDASYPGSTYTLTYDARADVLRGTYFEANYGQTFPIEFAREK